MNYTYILRCGDDSLYTGWTNHLTKRVADHNAGRGAKYTKAHLPVELVYYEIFDTKEEAMKRECAIKKLSRPQKERLIASTSNLLRREAPSD
ncbi:GIY-YIG nuclease family protein [Candidatus Merdisoma sp. HCP28S3_D10]|uniref:GIY-YIG nuclease family protein n=1 Tax=unclassified Candidatus Merdisoma TaxID=3099611 RepID=UPI003F8925D9